MAVDYIIRAALDEQTNNGWVWIGGPSSKNLTSRVAVAITRQGCGRGVYVDARIVDRNFLSLYNHDLLHPDPKNRRIDIDLDQDTIVMGDWYRRALGISKTTSRNMKSGIVRLTVKQVGLGGVEALFTACHNPDPMVRLAARFSMLGLWLGALTLLDPALKVGEHFVESRGYSRSVKAFLPIAGTTEYLHAWFIIVFAVLLAIPCFLLCRGRPQPEIR
jgi:hypothetical protein